MNLPVNPPAPPKIGPPAGGTALARGLSAEGRLDSVFARWYHITPATRGEQRAGIDRHFRARHGPERTFTVEYKADWQAHRTGRVFLELARRNRRALPGEPDRSDGWALTSQADWLVYYVVHEQRLYLVRFGVLREKLPGWRKTYPVRRIGPPSFRVDGLCVPTDEFGGIASDIVHLVGPAGPTGPT